jgi:hypothetical protein
MESNEVEDNARNYTHTPFAKCESPQIVKKMKMNEWRE